MACGIAHEPKLVIMDEPTVGIDPQSRNRILDNVKALNDKGTSIIYTSHYMPEIEQICSRMTVIDHGRFITAGTKQEISASLEQYTVMKVCFSGDSENIRIASDSIKALSGVIGAELNGHELTIRFRNGEPVIDSVFKASAEYSLRVTDISTSEPSLEEMFLTITGTELRDSKG